MAIKINWQDLLKRYINWQEIVRVYKNGGQIRPETVPPVSPLLCFTAEEANSTITLHISVGYPSVWFEKSYDGISWSQWNLNSPITLNNIWDKVYIRNASETPTILSTDNYHYYFTMTWLIWASWDINYLLCKYSTNTLTYVYCYQGLFMDCISLTTPPLLPSVELLRGCYFQMFQGCTSLRDAPHLPATVLPDYCYQWMLSNCSSLTNIWSLNITNIWYRSCYGMFLNCSSLAQLVSLPATSLSSGCYGTMFRNCPLIKLSETQTWEYQTPYRIPTSLTGTEDGSLYNMFDGTWWTFTGTPSINTTYYTSNQVI